MGSPVKNFNSRESVRFAPQSPDLGHTSFVGNSRDNADVFGIGCAETGWHIRSDSCRSASSLQSQLAMWFQLTNVWSPGTAFLTLRRVTI